MKDGSVKLRAVSSVLQVFRARRDAASAISDTQRIDSTDSKVAHEAGIYDGIATVCFDYGEKRHRMGTVEALYLSNPREL